eukprot:CAMPEP_0119060562 /NCGR_PEP_ID=MMETSP1178-20130426/4508_1 /TAXON_ID=33656 /ORGANISM="unid sp, Strain CCMP2000" /LENGTH=83 /DNA_ID=CAMNT_0007041677 /DNA_START=141 /DNA_END=392 /DNA_ORIENTATION=+
MEAGAGCKLGDRSWPPLYTGHGSSKPGPIWCRAGLVWMVEMLMFIVLTEWVGVVSCFGLFGGAIIRTLQLVRAGSRLSRAICV